VPAGAGTDKNQSVHARVHAFARKARIDDVGKDKPAIGVDGVQHATRTAQSRDHHGRLMLQDEVNLILHAAVGVVGDNIDDPGRMTVTQVLPQASHPAVELFQRARIRSGKGSGHAGKRGRPDKARSRHEEHGGRDGWNLEACRESVKAAFSRHHHQFCSFARST